MFPARSTTDIFEMTHSELLKPCTIDKFQAELVEDSLPRYKKLIFPH